MGCPAFWAGLQGWAFWIRWIRALTQLWLPVEGAVVPRMSTAQRVKTATWQKAEEDMLENTAQSPSLSMRWGVDKCFSWVLRMVKTGHWELSVKRAAIHSRGRESRDTACGTLPGLASQDSKEGRSHQHEILLGEIFLSKIPFKIIIKSLRIAQNKDGN